MSFLSSPARESAPLPTGGYGLALLETALVLVVVCVSAWLFLRWVNRRGSFTAGGPRRVHVVERLALDPRRHLYLVEVGQRLLLVGVGETGAPSLLTEIDPNSLPARTPSPVAVTSFADLVRRIRGDGGPNA